MNNFYRNNFKGEKGRAGENKKFQPDKENIAYKFLNKLVKKAQKNLSDSEIEELKEKRGLSKETIKKFKLGLIDSSLEKELKKSFDSEKLVETGWYKYECKLCDEGYRKTFTDLSKFQDHVREEHQYDRINNIKSWTKSLLPEEGIVIPYLKSKKAIYANIRNKDPGESEPKYIQPHNRSEETRKTFEGGVFPAYDSNSERLLITEGEFDALAAYEKGYDAVAIAGVSVSESGKKKLASIIKQRKNAVYIADNDIPGLEAIGILAGELNVKDAKIKAQISEGQDLSDQVAGGKKIEVDGKKVQEILLNNYKKIHEEEHKLNYVNEFRELFYYSLVGMKESDKEAWIKKFKEVLIEVEDKEPTIRTLRKEGKEFSEKKYEKVTERSERSERTERGFEQNGSTLHAGVSGKISPKDFLDESILPRKRLSGYINDDTFFHTVFLYKEGKQRPYVITSDKEIVSIKDKMEEIKAWAKRKEDLSLKNMDTDKWNYQYFKYGEKEYKLRHRVSIKEELEIYGPNNGVMEYFEQKKPSKEVYDRVREKVKEYWDHYDEKWFDVVTAWIIHTYLIMGTGYTVYLLLKGKEDTGKSTLQKIMARLAYNGFFTGKSTSAVTSRIAHILQATINQDEFEKLNEDMKLEIQGVYNTGQRKGGKYTFTNTNKGEIADQIEALYSYSPKTLSVNSLHGFASNFLSRNIIIEATRTTRSLENIENIKGKESDEFQDIRNEICAYCLFNHEEIINSINGWNRGLSMSGREADKLSLICGIVDHFKSPHEAKVIKEYLESISNIQNDNVSSRVQVTVEYLVEQFGDEKKVIEVKPKEIAEEINEALNIEGEYKASARSVGNIFRNYSILRDDSQVSRSSKTGGYVYSIPRKYLVDALTRFEMYELRDELVGKEGDNAPTHVYNEDGESKNQRSVSSVHSERSVKNSTRNQGLPSKSQFLNFIENHDKIEVPKVDIWEEFGETDKLKKMIKKLLSDGDLYEPKPDKIKKL